MTYDWGRTVPFKPGEPEWFAEIDRRFFEAAYYARDRSGRPFGRLLDGAGVNGAKVLEIGCGMGTHAAVLAMAGANLTAVDQTQTAVEMTQLRFDLASLPGRIMRADAERLPFPDRSFDVVWSWGVIHHSSSFETCLAEIARVLRDGGRLMLMVYYRPSLVYYVHCGVIRGVLLLGLLRKNLEQIYVDASDGFYARTFTLRHLRGLLRQDYGNIRLSIVGQKAELYPIPRCGIKQLLEHRTPDWLASAFLRRWGSMVVVEAVRRVR
jgi:SAM-dependent methyltransferase